jgi:diguanylate cyclase (GGDEF)-like protein
MILDIYSIIIILIIYFHAYRSFDKESLQDKIFMRILYSTVLMLVVDILSRFDGKAHFIYPAINTFGNFMIFLMNPILPSLWLLYVYSEIYSDGRKINRIRFPLSIINVFNVILLIISQFYGWYYYIDSNNVYHRGPFFIIPACITIVIVFVAFVLTLLNYKRLEKKSFLSLIFFSVPPFVCIILQILFYGLSLVLNSVVFSILVVFLNIQNHGMYTDHLTGINNRKKLDVYLRSKICSKNEDKGLSAILIDINNFKFINDTYGHNTGDHALEITAKLLKSCLNTSDFIARFGGDEFCIILEISNRSELETMIIKINSCLEKYNRSSSQPYQISLSIGYAVYDYHSHMSAEEFLKQVDLLMYEDKQSYRNKLSTNY